MHLLRGNVSEQWVRPTYTEHFRSSTYIINTALVFLLDFLNEELFNMMSFDIQELAGSLFRFNQTYLGYHDGYIALGATVDWRNTTIFGGQNNTKKVTEPRPYTQQDL